MVLAFYLAEAAGKQYGRPLGVAFLRDCLKHPGKHGIEKDGDRWKAPEGSMIYKSLKHSAQAQASQGQRRYIRAQDEQFRLEQLQKEADAAAWATFPADERAMVEAAVARDFAANPFAKNMTICKPGGPMFMGACYKRMRGMLIAQADRRDWSELPEDCRQEIEAAVLAAKPLLRDDPDALRRACLDEMLRRHGEVSA